MRRLDYRSTFLLWRLLQVSRPYWPHLTAVVLLSLLAAPITLLSPLPIKIVVDNVVGAEPLPWYLIKFLPIGSTASESVLLAVAAGILIASSLFYALQWTSSWLLQVYTGEKLVLRLRSLLFRHVQQLALSYHDKAGSTDSTYRIQHDAAAIQNILVYSLIPLLTAGFPLVGMIVVTFFIDWQLTAIAMATCPFLILWVRIYGRPLRERWKDVKQVDSGAMSVVQEVLSALRVVRAYGREDHEQGRFEQQSNRRIHRHVGAIAMHCRFELLVGLTIALGTAGVLYVGGTHVRRGILSLGELLMVMAYVAQIFGPLREMTKSSSGLANGLASAERVFAVLDQGPDTVDLPDARRLKRARGRISFENVGFSYVPSQPVLRDVSFEVQAGTSVGIQGRTGSGKSTLLSLLLRFHDPDSGRILLDGVDLRAYRLVDLRNQVAIVLQEPVLFATSIRENIAYGRAEATHEEIVEAARLANAHDFVAALPEGYDTVVGERGVTLSGGERQRIALARAFLRDAPILILDEPTSSVDMSTEALIMEAMTRLMRGRTTFLVAHRLSTLDNCDFRYELDGNQLRPLLDAGQRGESTVCGLAT